MSAEKKKKKNYTLSYTEYSIDVKNEARINIIYVCTNCGGGGRTLLVQNDRKILASIPQPN